MDGQSQLVALKHVLQPIPWAWREKCSCFPQSRLHAAKDAPSLLQPFRTAECREWYHLFCNMNFTEFALFSTESETRMRTSFSLSPTCHKTSSENPNTHPPTPLRQTFMSSYIYTSQAACEENKSDYLLANFKILYCALVQIPCRR